MVAFRQSRWPVHVSEGPAQIFNVYAALRRVILVVLDGLTYPSRRLSKRWVEPNDDVPSSGENQKADKNRNRIFSNIIITIPKELFIITRISTVAVFSVNVEFGRLA